MKIIKESLHGSIGDPTMPILIPKNNAKIFKLMQKGLGLKQMNKKAQIDEDFDNDFDRMDGLTSQVDLENLKNSSKNIATFLIKDGFDKDDVLEYLHYIVDKTVNTSYNINKNRYKK